MPDPAGSPTERGWLLRLYPALGVPAFRLLWAGLLPAQGAQAMNQVASGYAAFALTGSATMLGLVSFAAGIPGLLLTLVGGVVADRWPRPRVLLITQVLMLLSAVVMAMLVASGRLEIWHLVVAAILQFAAFSFNGPARQALVGEVVGRALMRNAVALTVTGVSLARIVGPSLAGLLASLPALGLPGVFATIAGLYLVGLLTLLRFLRAPRVADAAAPPPAVRPDQSGWAQLREGVAYLFASPLLRTLLLMGLVPILFAMPLQSLLPAYAERVFEAGAAGLGILAASLGAGAVLGSVGAASLTTVRRPLLLQLGVGLALGVALLGFALAPSFGLALPLLVVVGAGQAGYNALNQAQVLASAEPRLHGRVMSVNMTTLFLAPIVTLPLAALTDLVGDRLTIGACGALTVVTMLALLVLHPAVREAV